MGRVISGDGTAIAFERSGEGPPGVLVGAGRALYRPLAGELAKRFTVFNYDRRGRGESGDTAPYAVEREIEDLGAIIAEAGGAAPVYGHSSGAALALRAAAHGLPIEGLVLHEPPYTPEDERWKRYSREVTEKFEKLLAEGRRGEAIAHLFGAAETSLPPGMAEDLMWPGFAEDLSRNEEVLAMADAFAHDLEVVDYDAGGAVPTDLAGAVTVPALVLTDGTDYPSAIEVGEKLADAMPGGRHVVLEDRDQDGDPEEEPYADAGALAQAVAGFFADPDDGPERAGR